MPRKKSVKRSRTRQVAKKREAVKAVKSNALANTRKAEQQLMDMPGKLAKQLNKEISAQKKRESKLKNLSAKQKNLAKKAEARVNVIAKGKATPTSTKKLAKANKLLKIADKAFKDADQQLQAVSNSLAELVAEHAKFVALGKHLSQFDKASVKVAKAPKAAKAEKTKAKVKAKTKAKRKVKPVAMEPAATQAEEATPFDQMGFDEVTELAS